jgi:hypothetical protein
MSWRRSLSRCLLGTGVVLLGTAGAAGAQNATLYEVTETMKVRGRGAENKVRAATATLAGSIAAGTSLCPTELTMALGLERCGVVAQASDSLSLATGKGPVRGSFAVIIPGDNPVDGHEYVIARGSLHGVIDLASALLEGMPMGGLKGTWSARGEAGGPLHGLTVRGHVSGLFRLPFVYGLPQGCLDDSDPTDCWYVSKASYLFGDLPHVYPKDVQPNEHSLGVPTVRLDLTFETTARGRDRDRDDD